MAKCKTDSEDESPQRKRQKMTTGRVPEKETQVIQSAEDLRSLLAFQQDAGPVVRQKIHSFSLFLHSIACKGDSDGRQARRKLLLDYLRFQSPRDGADSSGYLTDVIKTWQFAAQSNVESTISSIVSVLALLLNTVSNFIEFREHGNLFCHNMLQQDQLKLLEQCLSASKVKVHLISPCLRLLTEVVSFDGGHAASSAYRQREITLKRLEVFLGMRRHDDKKDVRLTRKPSVRCNALAYFLANIRLQSSAAKASILAQRNIVRAVLDDIADDSPDMVLEILKVLKMDVAMDSAISHLVKGRLFNEWALGQLATLYNYRKSGHESRIIHNNVHDFFLFLCTSPDCGLLDKQTVRAPELDCAKTNWAHGTGQKSPPLEKPHQHANRNARLSLFLQGLRPYANVLHDELILAVFQNTPEMVSDYFSRKKSFSFDPGMTSTWIGYSSFLLATIQLPLRKSFIYQTFVDDITLSNSTIIESIIPHPLTQKVMSRCLNQNVNLVKYLTIRILNAAFEKLARVLRACEDAQHDIFGCHGLYTGMKAASRLRDKFCVRVPEMKHVIMQFRNCPQENGMLRESITRLIASYYTIIPQEALGEKLDISVALSSALNDIDSAVERLEGNGLRLVELEHMIRIAYCSPNMQWWHKSETMRLSSFTLLLKLHLDRKQSGAKSQSLLDSLKSVVKDNQILYADKCMSSLEILVLSLHDSKDWKPSKTVFEFLDSCVLRFVRKPVHYYDILIELIKTAGIGSNSRNLRIDLLLVTIMEQWSFLVKRTDASTIDNVSTWLVRYIEMARLGVHSSITASLDGEANRLLLYIRDQLMAEVDDKECRATFMKSVTDTPCEVPDILEACGNAEDETNRTKTELLTSRIRSENLPNLMLIGPPEEHDDHVGLTRWVREDVQDAITEGFIGDLVFCLCSKYAEIRKQALTCMRTFVKKLEASEYIERQQTSILAREIVETAEHLVSDAPLPYFAGELASSFFLVLADPLHFMYAKVNKFLNKGPTWDVTRLPSYWVDKILLNPPTDDDTHYIEAEWLLTGLKDGLRTSTDMEIYRKCHIFERLLSFSASPSLPEGRFDAIVDLLFRCTYVGGSSTLITRCGLISWIYSRLASNGGNSMARARLASLASRTYETSDLKRVDDWSHGTLHASIDRFPEP